MKPIILIGIVLCGNAWAECNYGTALTNMVYALEQPRATLDASFTNQLATWIGDTTNVFHVANIDLVRAISYADIAEDDISGDALLPQVFLICSNIMNSVTLPTNVWQRGAAGVIMSGVYSFDGKYSIAHSVATNCMLSATYELPLGEDISLWNAMARHLEVQGLSIDEALRCYAAIAVLTESPSSNVTSYTNALPESILVKIREL
jgi:hypothetical protein